MFEEKYPLKVSSVIIAPVAQKHYFQALSDLPFPTRKGMQKLAEYCHIPGASVRGTLSRMCREGLVASFTDETGTVRYKMSPMLQVVSDQAAFFGRCEGFTLVVFHFKADDAKERYRVREVLGAFGFRKLAQNVYLNIRVDAGRLTQALAQWNLQDNVFVFDCPEIQDLSMIRRIADQWDIAQWRDRLEAFYGDLRDFFDFGGLEDEAVYYRFSYGYSAFFVYVYDKHPLLPESFFGQDYPLGRIMALLETTLSRYGRQICRHYTQINR